jgi:hypothetical protein
VTTATATPSRALAPDSAAAPSALADRALGWAGCLLPGALTAYLAFNSGGRAPDVTAVVLLVLALVLATRVILGRQPFGGLGVAATAAAVLLALFAAWVLASSAWSDAPIRATTEFQRAALYLVALVLFGSFLRRRGGLALAVRGLAVAILGICVAALASRLYPDAFIVDRGLSPARLSYPIGYWNGLGLLAGVGVVLLLHLASDVLERRPVRALAAGAVPVAALTIYFTFSRGATGAVVGGVIAYLLVGRPRGALAALLATAPATFIALQAAYDADLLGTDRSMTPAAVVQGHHVAGVLVACCAAAIVLRLVLSPLDARLAAVEVSPNARRGIAVGAVLVAFVGLGTALALHAPHRIKTSWESFTRPENSADARTRFRSVTLDGRQDHWDVALGSFRKDRLKGVGAGTFEVQWLQSRPSIGAVKDAHSLYIETLGELGLVGLVLLAGALATILVALAVRARGRRRPLFGAVFAASLMWAVHAGVDWDWELTAVSLWVFALAGMALARTSAAPRPLPGGATWALRAGVAALCLFLAVGALRMVVSSSSLSHGIAAYKSGDCKQARSDAGTSLDALDSQPQANALVAYCDALAGHRQAAVAEMREAVRLDPRHWRYRYGLAIVRAMAGTDPRPDLAAARRLNPLGELLTTGVPERLAHAKPAAWRSLAARAPRPID